MKRFLYVLITAAAILIPLTVQGKNENASNSNTSPIVLGSLRKDKQPICAPHRAPMHIDVEAYYDFDSKSIEIIYDGENTGEVYLYLNGAVIDYSTEINTSFQAEAPGLYKIEIVTENWSAEGSFELE